MQNAVTRNMVVRKAKSLAQTDEIKNTYPNISSFKFSINWLSQFLHRNDLSNRRRTTVAQYLPAALVERQSEFLSLILFKRNQYNYPVKYIGNMDETPLAFDMPSPVTLEKRGAKTVSIRTTGHEKACFTVILGCLADGTKLPPVCIFKLKNVPREVFPPGVIIRVNEKGWCNELVMHDWIDNVWTERNPLGNPQSLLILDAFKGHLVDSIKHRFSEKNTHLAVIPCGMTSKLQPLDVAINKNFKHQV